MHHLRVAALAAVLAAACVPALADPVPYQAAGQTQAPMVINGVCGTQTVGSQTFAIPCAPGVGMPVADPNNAAFQGVVPITPGTAVAAARSIGFVITMAGTATFTFPDGSTITLSLPMSGSLQTLPFAVTLVTLPSSGGAAGQFWNLK